jgi:hypothetical protein
MTQRTSDDAIEGMNNHPVRDQLGYRFTSTMATLATQQNISLGSGDVGGQLCWEDDSIPLRWLPRTRMATLVGVSDHP